METNRSNALTDDAFAYLGQAANYYRFLSRLFYKELDAELIDEFGRTQEIIQPSDELDEQERAFALGNNKMVKQLQRRNPDTLTKTRCDYARVFLGAGQSQDNPVSPFESVYTSEEQLLMQGARDDVYRMFRGEHLSLDDEYNMPEDHISFEFQYLALLAKKAVAAHDSGDEESAMQLLEKYRTFFQEHVANWVPTFCDEAFALSKTSFYQGLVQCTKAWVLMEGELWGQLEQAA